MKDVFSANIIKTSFWKLFNY